jgi:hypothetical protein
MFRFPPNILFEIFFAAIYLASYVRDSRRDEGKSLCEMSVMLSNGKGKLEQG